jgi:hypothetical protein
MAELRVAIHQPEHFPYLGYFQKMQSADLFVILDNVNYRKNYFQNRNKLLNSNGVDEWFTIPVEKGATKKHIKDVQVSSYPEWRHTISRKLDHNFKNTFAFIYDSNSLLEINMNSILLCRAWLDIGTQMVYASDLMVSGGKSELLANIIKAVGGTTYVSGPSGKDYLDLTYFEGIDVEFFEPNVDNYYSTLYNVQKDLI